MDWLKYIPLVGSAVGGIVDLFSGGKSTGEAPKVQRARPQVMIPQGGATQAPPVALAGPQQPAMVTPQMMRMQAAQAKIDQLRAQRERFAPTMPQGMA